MWRFYFRFLPLSPLRIFPNKFTAKSVLYFTSIFRCFPLLFSRRLHNKFYVWKSFFSSRSGVAHFRPHHSFSSLPLSLSALSFFRNPLSNLSRERKFSKLRRLFTSSWPSRACNAFCFSLQLLHMSAIIFKIASYSLALHEWINVMLFT